MLITWLVPHITKQPNIINPIFIKTNRFTMTFLQCFYMGVTQHVIAAAMISVAHSNIQSCATSNWYIIQVQMQKHKKQATEVNCKVFPDLNLTILINYYTPSLTI